MPGKLTTVTNAQAIKLYNALNTIAIEKPTPKVVYWISKNLMRLEYIFQESEERRQIKDPELLKRQKALENTKKKFSLSIAEIQNNYTPEQLEDPAIIKKVREDQSQLKAKLEIDLQSDFEDVFDEYQRLESEYNEFLKEKVSIEFYLIPIETLPECFEKSGGMIYFSLIIDAGDE
jgi:uncharacterized protein YlxP (DUF503 family)